MATFNPAKPAVTQVIEPAKPATITIDLPLPVAKAIRLAFGSTPGPETSEVLREVYYEIEQALQQGGIHYPLHGQGTLPQADEEWLGRMLNKAVNQLS